MNCPKCQKEMKAKVITDRFDGESNVLQCPDGHYQKALPQSRMTDVFMFRWRVAAVGA